MRTRRNILPVMFSGIAMLILILDSKTAMISAQKGIELCLRTVIPSLFPFFIVSGIIGSYLMGQRIPILGSVCKFCRIPMGSESLLLLGLVGGYPVGAQLIANGVEKGTLSHNDGVRMLGFCSNAGPAFLFGMLSPLFAEKWMLWLLWLIQITSALLTGFLLPGGSDSGVTIQKAKPLTLPESLQTAVRIMVSICGWVILFRILLGFAEKWLFWQLPRTVCVMFSGLLELSNGCVLLAEIPDVGMRFLMAGWFLSFGGVCVAMQTRSVTRTMGSGWYFPGKAIQSSLAVFICLCIYAVITGTLYVSLPVVGLGTAFMIFVICRKLGMENRGNVVYNGSDNTAKEISYAVS